VPHTSYGDGGTQVAAEIRETVMTGLRRPAAAFLAAGAIAAFAIGQAHAQFVNPVPPPPGPPAVNPSSPNIVPQTPERPVSPSAPESLPGSIPAPSPEVLAPPASVNRETTNEQAKPAPSRTPVHHYASDGERSSRHYHRSWAVPVRGPSYYPGLGLFYPPYANPCHFRPGWNGYYGEYLSYSCGW
jgi:hypothetical protein